MNFEIYAYWNSVELASVFNAIAAITGSGDFNGLLRTLALVAVLSLAVGVLGGRGRHEDFWRWVFMLAIFHGILLVPKSNVVIVDRTGTAPAQTVANVPIGLASLAHGTSKIGDWLTTAFETAFSLPDDVQLRKNGTLFGHRVMREKLAVGTVNPILLHNLMEFYRECIWPDMASGHLSSRDISDAPDIWALFNDTNPGLLVTILDYTDPASISTVNCPGAYSVLTAQLALDVDQQMGAVGARLYPGMSASAAKAAFTGALATTTNYLLGVSQSAQVILRQSIVGNTIIDAEYTIPSQIGDGARAQVKLAQAQAIRSFNTSYGTMTALADETMPKLRNAVEILTYALFPIVVLIVVISGQFAFTFLKAYLGSLLWVQLWPPLYAVTNFIMNTKAASGLSTATAGDGLALKYYNYLGAAVASDQAVAGVLAVAIPVIAYGIVQATMSAASSVVSSVTASGAYGASASQGNLSMGNATLDTAKAGLQTAGQYNTAPTMRSGMPVGTLVGAGANLTTFADGTTAVDASGMQHKMNVRLNAGSRMSAALQQQSEQAEMATIGSLVSAAATTASALQQSADFVRAHAKGERAGTHYGVGDQTGFTQAVNQAQKIVDGFAQKHGLDQSQSAEILGIAEAAMQNPKALDLVSPLSVRAAARVTGKSDATARQLLEDASSYAKESGFSDAVERVRRASRESTFDASDESGRRAMAGIRASLDQSQQHLDQASASRQKSLAFKEAASRAKENSGAWETGLLRQFTDWMGSQYNAYAGRNFDAITVAQVAEKNPELLTPFVERFFKERVEPALSAGVGEVKSAGDVQAFFQHGKAGVPAAGNVGAKGRQWLNRVHGAAAGGRVDPDRGASSQLPRQVATEQGRAQQAINAGKNSVGSEGKPLEEQTRDRTAPGTQPLLGIAATNGVAQVLPDAVSKAMQDKLPGIDMSVGVSGSAVAEAAAERSRDAHPRDPVTQSLSKINDAIERGVSTSLPESVNQALERTQALGEQRIGEIIGSRQPQESKPPMESSVQGNGKAAERQGDILSDAWALGESKIGEVIGTRETSAVRPADKGAEAERSGSSEKPAPSTR